MTLPDARSGACDMSLQTFSKTAIGPAICRAAHQLFDDDPKILCDPTALAFVDDATAAALSAKEPALMERVTPERRVHFCLRGRIVEDCLKKAVASGVSQYVVLGAGLDSFAYRQPDWARGTTIMEVDHPRSQEFKVALVKARSLSPLRNVRYLPVDFASESLEERLNHANIDASRPIFVSWLGVTQYLPEESITNVLRGLANWPGGCGLVTTYALSDWSEFDAKVRARFQAMKNQSASVGEPWLSAYSETSMAETLRLAGFEVQVPFAVSDIQARYFSGRTDGLRAEGGPSRIMGAHTHSGIESWFRLE
jgi:methyltransferase (TIGR00027 family)